MSLCSIVEKQYQVLVDQVKYGKLEVIPTGEEFNEIIFRGTNAESFRAAVQVFDAYIDSYCEELIAHPINDLECRYADTLLRLSEDKFLA